MAPFYHSAHACLARSKGWAQLVAGCIIQESSKMEVIDLTESDDQKEAGSPVYVLSSASDTNSEW